MAEPGAELREAALLCNFWEKVKLVQGAPAPEFWI